MILAIPAPNSHHRDFLADTKIDGCLRFSLTTERPCTPSLKRRAAKSQPSRFLLPQGLLKFPDLTIRYPSLPVSFLDATLRSNNEPSSANPRTPCSTNMVPSPFQPTRSSTSARGEAPAGEKADPPADTPLLASPPSPPATTPAGDNDLEMVPVSRITPIDGVQVDAELRERKSNTDGADADAAKRLATMPKGTLDVVLDRAEMAMTPCEEVEVVTLCGDSSRGGSEIQPNEAPGSPLLKKGRPPKVRGLRSRPVPPRAANPEDPSGGYFNGFSFDTPRRSFRTPTPAGLASKDPYDHLELFSRAPFFDPQKSTQYEIVEPYADRARMLPGGIPLQAICTKDWELHCVIDRDMIFVNVRDNETLSAALPEFIRLVFKRLERPVGGDNVSHDFRFDTWSFPTQNESLYGNEPANYDPTDAYGRLFVDSDLIFWLTPLLKAEFRYISRRNPNGRRFFSMARWERSTRTRTVFSSLGRISRQQGLSEVR